MCFLEICPSIEPRYRDFLPVVRMRGLLATELFSILFMKELWALQTASRSS